MSDPSDAVGRVLPIQEVILHAMHGQQTWLQPAHVLGISPRTMRRRLLAEIYDWFTEGFKCGAPRSALRAASSPPTNKFYGECGAR